MGVSLPCPIDTPKDVSERWWNPALLADGKLGGMGTLLEIVQQMLGFGLQSMEGIGFREFKLQQSLPLRNEMVIIM